MKRLHSKNLFKVLLVLLLLFCGCAKKRDLFREDIAGKIGDHIYYSYNLYEDRNLDAAAKKELEDYLKTVDRKLTEDMYITGWCYAAYDERIMIYGQLRINGFIVPEYSYRTDNADETPNISYGRETLSDEIEISEGVYLPNEVDRLKEIDASGVIDPKDLIPQVTQKAMQHKEDLCDYDEQGVYGDYLLCYDIYEQRLIYDFRVNEYSEIILDALTGEVVKESYWDGTIID